jgi:hypothetical protein
MGETAPINIDIPPSTEMITTDLLIIGAGPAGASLACFLGSYGGTALLCFFQFFMLIELSCYSRSPWNNDQ